MNRLTPMIHGALLQPCYQGARISSGDGLRRRACRASQRSTHDCSQPLPKMPGQITIGIIWHAPILHLSAHQSLASALDWHTGCRWLASHCRLRCWNSCYLKERLGLVDFIAFCAALCGVVNLGEVGPECLHAKALTEDLAFVVVQVFRLR